MGARVVAGPTNWTTSGDLIAYSAVTGDIVAVRVADGDVRSVVATPDAESYPALSPNGRWLAYVSDRTGSAELWVKRYPDGVPTRVSQNGGVEPVWSRDGRELYYRRGNAIFGAAVSPGDALAFDTPHQLFEWPYFGPEDPTLRNYDVAPDSRFLMIRPSVATGGVAEPSSIVVVQNWTEELERRAPAR